MSKKAKGITLGECYQLNRAIFELSGSAPSMKGKIVYALQKNEGKLESLLRSNDKLRDKMLKKYVALNDDGSFKLTELTKEQTDAGEFPQYIYNKESDKEVLEKEVTALMEAPAKIELHKIMKHDFDNIDISPARNQNIGLIIEYLIEEGPTLM
jgi:hypothetical protein